MCVCMWGGIGVCVGVGWCGWGYVCMYVHACVYVDDDEVGGQEEVYEQIDR